MIKLFSLKQEKEKEAAAGSSEKKVAPGLIRMQKDVSEMKSIPGVEVFFPEPEDIMNFKIYVKPDGGYYKVKAPYKFVFDCKVPKSYPHDAPKVLCETQVWHPNIDMEGHVCLNILREDWKPVLTMNSVLMGLQFLMLEPNVDDPLNKDAANMLADKEPEFRRTVEKTMKGCKGFYYSGKTYDFETLRDR